MISFLKTRKEIQEKYQHTLMILSVKRTINVEVEQVHMY